MRVYREIYDIYSAMKYEECEECEIICVVTLLFV